MSAGLELEYDDSGKLISGGHEIKEKDFEYLQREMSEQFSCLSGRLLSLIEELGLPQKQEEAAKKHLRREVWERYDDLVAVIAMHSMEGYERRSSQSLPPEDFPVIVA